jgi:hypothetical protein
METDDGGRDEFAQRVLAAVREAGATEAWYDREEFAIGYRQEPGTDPPGWINMGAIYHNWQGLEPAEFDGQIRGFVDATLNGRPVPETWEEARADLRPVLRASTYGLDGTHADWGPLRRPALPYLSEMVVLDLPAVMSYVTDDMAAKWGVRPAEVFKAARANLTALAAGPPPGGDGKVGTVLRFVEDGDSYMVSRILLDGWLARLAPAVGGRPVAFVPDHSSLIVAADDPGVLTALFKLAADEYREAARSLSPAAYTCAPDGRVVPYRVLDDHPLAATVHRAEVMLAAIEYSQQGSWLEDEPDEQESYVAGLLVGTRPDGSVFTVASWGEGVDTLLPEAQYVGFSGEDGAPPFLVPWKTVVREANLLPVVGLDPPRYRVTGWPAPAVLDRLRARAETP